MDERWLGLGHKVFTFTLNSKAESEFNPNKLCYRGTGSIAKVYTYKCTYNQDKKVNPTITSSNVAHTTYFCRQRIESPEHITKKRIKKYPRRGRRK